jgi:wyosine [tRNA(Phe)-imidazoG37] synthetase (radical SAM superfamily)
MTSPRGHVYGPVPSRRLGASLGVDVVPMKACSYDCIYCQLGPTRTLTDRREPFFPVDEVLADVERRLGLWPPPDVITVAGSGEPTLFAGLGELIDSIKRTTRIPVALLTNGSLFHRADVRAEAARADVVLPSLDAGDEELFQWMNRPVAGLVLEEIVAGLRRFREEFDGLIWLEVMVLRGVTEAGDRVRRIADAAASLRPDRIHLNTPIRPPAESYAYAVSPERLARLCELFTPAAEAAAEPPGRNEGGEAAGNAREILALVSRRPCTVLDVAGGLGVSVPAALKALESLVAEGALKGRLRGGRYFYFRSPSAHPSLERRRAP